MGLKVAKIKNLIIKHKIQSSVYTLILLVILIGLFHSFKPLPKGTSFEGTEYMVPEDSVKFLGDTTYLNRAGKRTSEQHIFDEIFSMIDEAEKFILIDMFLFNDFQGKVPELYRGVSGELVRALVNKKRGNKDIFILVVTDDINICYGGIKSEQINELRNNGIDVVFTNMKKMRDSNLIYSPVWRVFFSWMGTSDRGGIFPNPLSSGGDGISLRPILKLLNFKANHRKVVLADTPDGRISSIISSANPSDASSAHSNTGFKVDDYIWKDIYAAEKAVLKFSGYKGALPEPMANDKIGSAKVKYVTEGKIKKELIRLLDMAGKGDSIDLVMFYLSERDVIKAFIRTANRGASVRIILDPAKDAFGRTKNGIPNRQTAYELLSKTKGAIRLKWYDTHGEQCHSKMALFNVKGVNYILEGSANLTRRNINNLNLEADVLIVSEKEIPAVKDAHKYFNVMWDNKDGKHCTVPYEHYKDENLGRRIAYYFQEKLGCNTF